MLDAEGEWLASNSGFSSLDLPGVEIWNKKSIEVQTGGYWRFEVVLLNTGASERTVEPQSSCQV